MKDRCANVKTESNKLTQKQRELLAKIESDCFLPFRIDHAAYHGGDLTGNPIRELMLHSEDVMVEIQKILTNANSQKNVFSDDDFASPLDFEKWIE